MSKEERILSLKSTINPLGMQIKFNARHFALNPFLCINFNYIINVK